MQFDTKSPVPKLLFSPVAAVPEEQLEIIKRQGKSAEAENAVKLTVFQQDEGEAPAKAYAPVHAAPTDTAPAEAAEVVEGEAEPVLREAKKTEAPTAAVDAASLINKWKKK